ncbi:MAG: hypothetical protein HY013_02445 [Candidatus Solibacter usitatus]|nr:hypothetical protein [Candidatus Solibacter usitatus]
MSKIPLARFGLAILLPVGLWSQAAPPAAAPAKPPAAAPAKPPVQKKAAAPKPAGLTVDSVASMQKAGLSEDLIVARLPTPAPAAASAPAPVPAPASAAPAAAVQPASAEKKRVAIAEFDYSTVMTSVQSVFGTHMHIGQGIRAMLTSRLANANLVTIVERAKVDALMKEQDFGASNRVKQGTGARIGRIKGADVLLMGDIVVFGRDDTKKGGGVGAALGALGPAGGIFGRAAQVMKEDKAVVALNYRLVDSETSEIIESGEARGESKRKSKNWAVLLGKNNNAVAADSYMTSSNFAETIIGEATMDCVNKIADLINKKVPTLAAKQVAVEARVADVSGSSLVITAGSNDGVAVGDKFEVSRVIREVKDPNTKEVLDVVTERVGDLVITTVRDKVSTGAYTGQPVKVNDMARKK